MSTVIIAAIIGGAAAIIAAITGPIAFHIYIERQNQADLTRLTYGKEVAIQVSDGTHLMVDANNKGTLFGVSKEINAWNIFTIVKAEPSPNKPSKAINDGDEVRFKAKVIGEWKYVSVRLNEEQQLAVRSDKLEPDQIFIICATKQTKPGAFNYGSPFALRALANKKTATCNSRRDSGNNRLITIYDHIKWSETFVFVNPQAKSDH
jgi:hypothetical protein